ncbi:MAG TPA: PASTA domain-containing protein, partial [Gaiellaceae bacterium]|nr:PASTA domain-containing protein [Gaiellaceae bacterium]
PAPTISGNTITYATGALPNGLHVLFGWLRDASGTQTPFRVAVTVESAPMADRPAVEKSIDPQTTTSVVATSGLATVTVPPSAWPPAPTPADFLVFSVDPEPALPSLGFGLAPGSAVIAVDARWALAGTPVTEFDAPIEVLIPNPSGAHVIPATSQDGTTWRTLEPLEGTTLPADRRDGYYIDGAGVHVLTRHLTYFALGLDTEPPTPPTHLGGAIGADGLTIRWIPGRDNSRRLGNVVLFVNGEPYRNFGPTEYEAKLGPVLEDDTRTFHLVQLDAAGNASAKSETLRALPKFLGLPFEQARAALAARGFTVGRVTYEPAPGVAAGTVIAPVDLVFGVDGRPLDLVVAGTAPVQTRLVFQVANAKRVKVQPKRTTVTASVNVTRPSAVTATLYSPKQLKLYTWRLKVDAGRTVVKLKLPTQVRKPGVYRIVWIARSGSETVRRTITFRLVGPDLQQLTPSTKPIEVVLTGGRIGRNAVGAGLGSRGRVVASAAAFDTFLLVASPRHDVSIVVVDVDRHGIRFVADLRTVFPELRVLAVSDDAALRRRALRAGAVRALPRSSGVTLAKAIARVASSR